MVYGRVFVVGFVIRTNLLSEELASTNIGLTVFK